MRWRRLRSLMAKEFIQIKRDRRTLGMMVMIPFLWLLVFGYAASFDIDNIPTGIAGGADNPTAPMLTAVLGASSHFDIVDEGYTTREELEEGIRTGKIWVGVVPPKLDGTPGTVLVDGSNLFASQTALRRLQEIGQGMAAQPSGPLGPGGAVGPSGAAPSAAPSSAEAAPSVGDLASVGGLVAAAPGAEVAAGGKPDFSFEPVILYNPELRSANSMVPGLVGVVMVFIATIMTAVGVVREKENGTLEQLQVTPLSATELMIGKIAPYVVIAFIDLLIVVGAGVLIFKVPFAGSPLLLFGLSFIFLVCCLGIGLLVSTVSQTQQQAMQLAVFTLVPQILISGFVFPLVAIPWGVRWIAYLMPLTHFLPICRGIFIKDLGMAHLWPYALILLGYATVVVAFAAWRFRRRMV